MVNAYIPSTSQKLLSSPKNVFSAVGYTPSIHLRKILKLVLHGSSNKINQLIIIQGID